MIHQLPKIQNIGEPNGYSSLGDPSVHTNGDTHRQRSFYYIYYYRDDRFLFCI